MGTEKATVVQQQSQQQPKKVIYALPKDLADRFYERGHKLFKEGTGSALELERVAKELSKAISFCPDQFKHYVLFGNVYKKAADLSSAIFSYRYAYRLDDTSVPLKKLLAQSLSQQGQEILYLANMSLKAQIKQRNNGTTPIHSAANSRPGSSSGTINKSGGGVASRPGTSSSSNGNSKANGIPKAGGNEKDEKKPPTEVVFSKDKDGYDVSLFSKALGCFNESLKLENNDHKVWIYKTMCHVRLNENLDALQAVSRAIATSRLTNVEFYILRAKLYWARGLTDDGNRDIRAACTMDPEHPEIKAYIARSYAKAESLYRLGLLAFSEGDYKKALFNLQHALSVSTDDVKLYIMTSKIHRMMGNLQEAYSFIQQAAAIFNTGCNSTLALPEDIRIQSNLIFNDLALNYIQGGEYDRAIVLYNKIISDELASDLGGSKEPDYRFYVNRGDCYRALNQYQASIEDYSKGLSLEPGNWDIKTRLSLTYYLEALEVFNRFNDYSTAEKLLTFAIKHNPKVAEYYTIRGRTRYYTGDYPGSYQDYNMSLQLNPDNPGVRETLKQFNSKQMEQEETTGTTTRPNEKQGNKGGNKNMSKCTSGGISYEPVPTTERDIVSSLLDYKIARKLPGIVQQRKQAVSLVTKKQPPAATLLPQVNPNMVPALLVREEAVQARKKLQKFLTDKVDIVSKGPLFQMFDAASALARSRGISHKRAQEHKKGYSITATSAVALKKLSQERSRQAMKNGTVILSDTRKDSMVFTDAQREQAGLGKTGGGGNSSNNSKGGSLKGNNGKGTKGGRRRTRSGQQHHQMSDELDSDSNDDDDSSLGHGGSRHTHGSSHSMMARSRHSQEVGDDNSSQGSSQYYDDDEGSTTSNGSHKPRRNRSFAGINLSASDSNFSAHHGDGKRYHLKALDEWAREAAAGKGKGKFHRRHGDKKKTSGGGSVGSGGSRSHRRHHGGDSGSESDGHSRSNSPSQFHDGMNPRTGFGAVDTGTNSWNVNDTMKAAEMLESTLLMSEEEEAAMIAKLKLDKELAAIEHRKRELARLRGEVVVGGGKSEDSEDGEDEDEDEDSEVEEDGVGGGDASSRRGIRGVQGGARRRGVADGHDHDANEQDDVVNNLAGTTSGQQDNNTAASAAKVVSSFYARKPKSFRGNEGNSTDDEDAPTRHQSMLSCDQFGGGNVHDINDC